jgi:competence protein ComGC
MCSFISIFITVGVCLGIYAYIKKKYAAQIALLEEQIANFNLDLVKQKTHIRQLEDKVFVGEREISNYKTRLETLTDINKELNAKYQSITPKTSVTSTTPVDTTTAVSSDKPAEAPKKRGRKPGYKKPFYKKKSGGKPS